MRSVLCVSIAVLSCVACSMEPVVESVEVTQSDRALYGVDCGGVIAGDVVVTNAAELAAIAGIEEIRGELSIVASDLTHLDGLECLQETWGLRIEGNAVLVSLDGLSGLTFVDGNLEILDNPVLPRLWGLHNLMSVDEVLHIQGNAGLRTLKGLGAMSTVGAIFALQDNDSLTSLDGLWELRVIGLSFIIRGNDAMVSLDGACALEQLRMGALQVIDNPVLQSVSDLKRLAHIASLRVAGDFALPTCDVLLLLERLVDPPGFVSIADTIDGPLCPSTSRRPPATAVLAEPTSRRPQASALLGR